MDCSITRSDLVYEVEPENELFTSELAVVARKVVVLVKQPIRAHLLSSQLQHRDNVEVREADFLRYEIQDQAYKVFSNVTNVEVHLPEIQDQAHKALSNVTFITPSKMIKKLLSAKVPPLDSFLVIQEHAANLYSGTPKETEFSVLVKPWFDVTILRKFRRVDFQPAPSVDIVLLNLKMRKPPLISPFDAKTYRHFIKFSFDAGKKGLDTGYMNIFTDEKWKRISKDLGVKYSIKPTELTFDQLLQIFGYFTKLIPDSKRKPLLKRKGS
jgi:16S rRNA A1518/A1519 N6-dimethyltransferase RsmA/KsgA/DIM1 with predicted DNA glycosylase/AP lyase activity